MGSQAGRWLWVVLALIIGIIIGVLVANKFNPLLSALHTANTRIVVGFAEPGGKINVLSIDGDPLPPLCCHTDTCDDNVPRCDEKFTDLWMKLEHDFTTVFKAGILSTPPNYGDKVEQNSSRSDIPALINSATAAANIPVCDRYFSLHGGKYIYMDPDPCQP